MIRKDETIITIHSGKSRRVTHIFIREVHRLVPLFYLRGGLTSSEDMETIMDYPVGLRVVKIKRSQILGSSSREIENLSQYRYIIGFPHKPNNSDKARCRGRTLCENITNEGRRSMD